MNYTYKSRATKKSYALEQIIDLPATEREVLRNDLEDAIDGMRREMYEERHNVDENDKWFRAVNYKLGICTSFLDEICLLYTSPSPRDRTRSRMPSSA